MKKLKEGWSILWYWIPAADQEPDHIDQRPDGQHDEENDPQHFEALNNIQDSAVVRLHIENISVVAIITLDQIQDKDSWA